MPVEGSTAPRRASLECPRSESGADDRAGIEVVRTVEIGDRAGLAEGVDTRTDRRRAQR